MQITDMIPAHWLQVRQIYLEGLSTGNATFETTAPSWEEWDAAHLPFARLVALIDDKVAAWAALSPVSKRAAYAGVAEVSVYVSQKRQGQKLGQALLAALIDKAERSGIWTLQASIFPENESSLAIHKKYRFREVGRRMKIAQLNGVWRDTILLERRM